MRFGWLINRSSSVAEEGAKHGSLLGNVAESLSGLLHHSRQMPQYR
jgi:hypothetical protein